MSSKVVIITGASSGIGAALGELLAKKGDSVVLVARRADALKAVADRCGPNALAIVADVTRREDVKRMIAESIARFGHIDVLVNNVGQGITRPPSELTDEDIDDMIRANVKSAMYGAQEILPHFKSRGTGHVINISSMLGRMPLAMFRSAYIGAKHFLNAITATFRMEVQETHPNIQFSLVSPPVVYTEFGVHAKHGGPDSRQLAGGQDVGDAIAVIARVMDSRRPDVYTRAGSRAAVLAYFDKVGEDP